SAFGPDYGTIPRAALRCARVHGDWGISIRPVTAVGPNSVIRRCLLDVRIAPENGPRRPVTACRMSGTSRHERLQSTMTRDLQYRRYIFRTPLARSDCHRVRRGRDPSPVRRPGDHRRASMVQGALRTWNAAQIPMTEFSYNGAHTAGNFGKFQSPSPARPTAPPRTLSAESRRH